MSIPRISVLQARHVLTVVCIVYASALWGQKKFSARMDSLMARHPGYSGVVLLADFGKVRYEKAVGYSSYQRLTPMDHRDLFELASISKTFTAMAIMLLEQDGKLGFDDSLSRFLDIPYRGITIRHLLTHTSGLPDYQAVMDAHWDKTKVAGNAEILEYLNRYAPPVLFPPGDRYEYSNTGYVLLGSIVEKASGQDFVDFCRERIFRKLGMSHTNIRSNAQKAAAKHFALGHIWSEEKQRYIRADSFPASDYTLWLGNRKGPGRVSSTARDLLAWDQALYSDRLLPQQQIRHAFQPAKLTNDSLSNYGFGWMLKATPALGITVWHSGDNPGYRTRLMRYTGRRYTLVLLNNNAYPAMDELVESIEQLLASIKS